MHCSCGTGIYVYVFAASHTLTLIKGGVKFNGSVCVCVWPISICSTSQFLDNSINEPQNSYKTVSCVARSLTKLPLGRKKKQMLFRERTWKLICGFKGCSRLFKKCQMCSLLLLWVLIKIFNNFIYPLPKLWFLYLVLSALLNVLLMIIS